jgi:hypothetical protein
LSTQLIGAAVVVAIVIVTLLGSYFGA